MSSHICRDGIIKNTAALYAVQLGNYIVPLLLLPYIARVLQTHGYGQLVIAQAIASYGILLTDYGFQLSGTRRVARAISRGESVEDIFWSVTLARLSMAILGAFICAIVFMLIPGFDSGLSISLATLVMLIGNAATPIWLFQGYERMGTVSVILLSSRILSALMTVILVRSPEHYGLALWAQAIGFVLPAFYAQWKSYQLIGGLGQPRWELSVLAEELKSGWPLFQTLLFSALLTNSGALIVGTSLGNAAAGGYGAIERIAKAASSLLVPFTQSVYPRVNSGFSESYSDGIALIKRFAPTLLLLSIGMALTLIGVYYFNIVGLLFGSEYQRYADALLMFSPWMVLGVLNNILGIQYMTSVGMEKIYAHSFTISAVLSVALSLILVGFLGYRGVALSLVMGEGLLSVMLMSRIWNRNKQGVI